MKYDSSLVEVTRAGVRGSRHFNFSLLTGVGHVEAQRDFLYKISYCCIGSYAPSGVGSAVYLPYPSNFPRALRITT